jgi:hypothetical protein
VAQSTGGKPGEESSASRKLQVFGTIVGLVAFFLGVQSIGELKQKLFPSPAITSATPSPTTTQPASRSGHDREAVKWRYVQNADAACAKTLTSVPGRIDTITYDWMTRVLDARERFLTAWTKVPWPADSPVDEVYNAEVTKIWTDFSNATAAWREMRADLKAGNGRQYDLDRATFSRSHDSFVDGANRFGFQSCNYTFPTTSPWN